MINSDRKTEAAEAGTGDTGNAEGSATPWQHRLDTIIADVPDNGPVTVMDAQCALCARGARWIAHNDRAAEFRIIPMQSALGQALMHHYGLDPADPTSWLYLEGGRAHTSLDAVIRVGQRLGGGWQTLRILLILPRPLRNKFYYLVARNRYRLFGRADMCAMPDPDVQKRLIK